MSKRSQELAKELEERLNASLGITRALGQPDPSPDSEVAYFLMQSSTEELKTLRREILSLRKVVYLQQYQSAKST